MKSHEVRDCRGFRQALDNRLKTEASRTGLPLARLRKQVAFELFLRRLVAVAPNRWVLKGALALELRLKATTRPTRDIDLGRDDDEQAAIEDMTAAQQLALDDFFTYNAIRTDEFDRTDEFAAVRFHVTAHRAAVRRELARFRGREIDTAGDGFLATFDGPARAIQCACSIRGAVHGLGLEVRSGLHTGECELIDGGVGGIAVHTGARVAALAEPGEVLVSRTVRDLVAGSGLAFEDRGVSRLKGVEGDWQLYAVV